MSDFVDSFDVNNDDSAGDGAPETMSGDELAQGVFGDPAADAEPTAGAADTQDIYNEEPGAAAAPAPEQPAGINVNYEGTEFYAGETTFDANGDGVADTAVQDHGYQVEYYVDTDGDGNADELTITDADGNLISHEELVPGSDSDWQETPAPDTAAGDVTTSDAPDTATATEPGPASTTSTAPPGEAVPEGQSVPEGDMAVSIDGTTYDVGSASLDITGDGVADTVVVENGGNVEYYVDTDQDGVADQIIVLDEADGSLVNHEVFDPASGAWVDVTAESAAN